MADGLKKNRFPLPKIIFQPNLKIQQIISDGAGNKVLWLTILAGFVFVYSWADLFNLGDRFLTGQILAVALIGGPILGFMTTALIGFFLNILTSLLDRQYRPRYKKAFHRTPLLFWLTRLFAGKTRANKLWSRPGFCHLDEGSSRLFSSWNFLIQTLNARKLPFSKLMGAVSRIYYPLVFAALVLWLEFTLYDGAQFSSQPDSVSPGLSMPLFYIFQSLKLIFLASFFYLLYPLTRVAFGLSKSISLLAAAGSVLLTLGTLLLFWRGILSIDLF